jgi:hypothetical protein
MPEKPTPSFLEALGAVKRDMFYSAERRTKGATRCQAWRSRAAEPQ